MTKGKISKNKEKRTVVSNKKKDRDQFKKEMDEIDYHCLQNFQSSYDKFYHELDPHNFSILNPNLFYLEKSTPSPYYEKQKTHCISQKHSSPVFNEIFCLNNPNENDKNQKIEENNTNSSKNLNNQIQSNLIESQSCNYSLKENENSGDSNLNEFHSGRWSKDEHEKFIEGILKYGNEWKKVQNVIKTRSSTQARSHAQKYFLRLKKEASPDILCDQDKLFQYIINSNNNIKNSLELSNEQKEKLIAVIKSNIKSEENNLNKTDKEGNNSNINEKDDSGFDDLNEEEDNKNNQIRYNKNSALDYPSEAYIGTRDHYPGRNMSENNKKCCHT